MTELTVIIQDVHKGYKASATYDGCSIESNINGKHFIRYVDFSKYKDSQIIVELLAEINDYNHMYTNLKASNVSTSKIS